MAIPDLLEFRLLLPAKWVELDLDPKTEPSSSEALVAARGGYAVAQGVTPDQLRAVLEGVVGQARAVGAVYAAFYSDVLGENRPVTASLVASIVPRTAGPPPEGADATAVAAALRNLLASEGEAEVRPLPAGPAVRVQGRVEVPAPGGTMVPVLNLRYFVPVPGLDRIAALEFSTPNLALAEPFTELFDAIAGSLTWT